MLKKAFFCLDVISKSAAVGRRVTCREMTLFNLKLQFGFDELNNMRYTFTCALIVSLFVVLIILFKLHTTELIRQHLLLE